MLRITFRLVWKAIAFAIAVVLLLAAILLIASLAQL
jgi:hypothetical protein